MYSKLNGRAMGEGGVLARSRHLKRVAAGASLAAASAAVVAAAAPAVAGADSVVLGPGSSGPTVGQVQRALHVKPTNHYDHKTRVAVVSYQMTHKLKIDGVVGPQTERALLGRALYTQPTSTSSSQGASTQSSSSGSGASSRSSGSSSSSSGGYSIPSGVVQCESGGNYGAVNPSSGAGGAYQITPSTWHAYGGSGSPQSAPKAEQDAIASKIYHSQGSSAWSCAG